MDWGLTGFNHGEGNLIQGIAANPYLLEGLSHSTTYDCYVRANCGDGDFSTWEGPNTFTTAFVPPYTQNFDDTLNLPPGWKGTFYISPEGGIEGTHALTYNFWIFDWDCFCYASATSPVFEVVEDINYKLKFKYRILEGTVPYVPDHSINFNVRYTTDYGIN